MRKIRPSSHHPLRRDDSPGIAGTLAGGEEVTICNMTAGFRITGDPHREEVRDSTPTTRARGTEAPHSGIEFF